MRPQRRSTRSDTSIDNPGECQFPDSQSVELGFLNDSGNCEHLCFESGMDGQGQVQVQGLTPELFNDVVVEVPEAVEVVSVTNVDVTTNFRDRPPAPDSISVPARCPQSMNNTVSSNSTSYSVVVGLNRCFD